jgi:hypothetical protein
MNIRTLLASVLAAAVLLVPRSAAARWLNPNTGRFQTMDSYERSQADPQSLHKYTYAYNSPINNTDPSGHETLLELLSVSSIDTDLRSMKESGAVAAKRAAKSKLFDLDLGFQWGAGSGGWGPHSFLYVPSKLTGIGLKYDVASDGSLIVRNRSKSQVLAEAWFGKVFRLAEFNLPQYITWSASAWVVAEGEKAETQLLDQQIINSLGLDFSYSFLPGTINCFKWTIVAGIEGIAISKFGN